MAMSAYIKKPELSHKKPDDTTQALRKTRTSQT
jgi:hypothetical protein